MAKSDRFWWVRIHRSCVKTDTDAEKLTMTQTLHKGNFNTQNAKSMWFDFPTKLHAIGFVDKITDKLPYLRITMGN